MKSDDGFISKQLYPPLTLIEKLRKLPLISATSLTSGHLWSPSHLLIVLLRLQGTEAGHILCLHSWHWMEHIMQFISSFIQQMITKCILKEKHSFEFASYIQIKDRTPPPQPLEELQSDEGHTHKDNDNTICIHT